MEKGLRAPVPSSVYTPRFLAYTLGSVHIMSKDPTVAPLIDPNYLSHPLDVEVFSDGVLFMQEFATREPFASFLKDGGKAFHPGFEHLTKETVG